MKFLMKWLFLFNYILLVHFYSICEGGGKVASSRARHRPSVSMACAMPKLKNGTVRMQRGGRMGYFFCANGFDIHGPMNIVCQMGRWKQEIPKCLKSGCTTPQARPNGYVMIDEKKQQAMLFCQDGYLSASSTTAYCDGTAWDRELGECRPDVQHTKSCDFETSDLCEWRQDGENDFPWVRRNGWTSFERLEFGPKHDHTTGKPLHGYYMVAEATNSRSTQKSRFWSPVYNPSDSENACFRFYYHMYGSKIGRLRVLYKPIKLSFDDIVDEPKYSLFEVANSQGNKWNEAFFEIEPITSDFQIIFEATGSNGLINDIAIDDVALLNGGDCIHFTKDKVTEEIGGIYEIQSCANRCNETESVRINGSTTLNQNGQIIEKCDCHLNCLELDTCCTDYQLKCLESDSIDSDITTTPMSDFSSDDNVLNDNTTPATEENENINKTQNTSTMASTTIPTTLSTVATTTSIKTPNSTLKTSTPMTTKTSTTAAIIIPTLTSNSTVTTTIITKLTSPTPSQTTSKNLTNKNSTVSIIPTKLSTITIKVIKVASTTTKPIVKTSSTSLKPKIFRTTIVPTTTKPTKSSRKETVATSSIGPKRIAVIKPGKSIRATSTDATINAHVMPISDTNGIPKISIIIAICILLSALLFVWKYFKANKWNHFNSHQIEFKSNYPTEGTEESLIRSDSFQIDNDFVDNETLIDCNSTETDVAIDGSDENAHANGNVIAAVDNDDNINANRTGTKPKHTSVERTKNRFIKNSNRCGRVCDQYSEKRCLMNSTADDEQFDFTLQTTL